MREVYLGPEAQAVIAPFLDRDEEAYLFSPAEAEQWRSEQRRRNRKTPLTPSQRARCRASRPKRPKRRRYDVNSYRRAIDYVVKRLNRQRRQAGAAALPRWSPLQLRHSRGTEVRKRYGLEGSQVALGHKHAQVTEVYAERDRELAMRIARELG